MSASGENDGSDVYREVMSAEAPAETTPFAEATRDYLFGELWQRPGLARRDRRLVTLTAVTTADVPEPIDDHVYAAFASGDIGIEEMFEIVLQIAVYAGWPKAALLEASVAKQWERVCAERGDDPPAWPNLRTDTLGASSWDELLAQGAEKFAEVNLFPGPTPNTPYRQVGVLGFVFGHVWHRPGLARRDRRLICITAAAVAGAPTPLEVHAGMAVRSGDVSPEEMREIVLHFAAYCGFAKAAVLDQAVEAAIGAAPANADADRAAHQR